MRQAAWRIPGRRARRASSARQQRERPRPQAGGDQPRARQALEQDLADAPLRRLVEGGRRLVEQQSLGLLEQRARDREQLLLVHRELLLPGPHRVEARRASRDVCEIGAGGSGARVLVVRTDEELQIAREALAAAHLHLLA